MILIQYCVVQIMVFMLVGNLVDMIVYQEKVYDKPLLQSEIQQNFNSIKTRYGL